MEDAPAGLEPHTQCDTRVAVELVAHQVLAPGLRDMVTAECSASSGSMHFECRGALLHYLLQEARVAIDADSERPSAFLLQVKDRQATQPYPCSSGGS